MMNNKYELMEGNTSVKKKFYDLYTKKKEDYTNQKTQITYLKNRLI